MAIMDKGKLLFSGNTDEALNQIKGKVWERKVNKNELEQTIKRIIKLSQIN
jgi:ABC-2 type transport system ATP-binding protein